MSEKLRQAAQQALEAMQENWRTDKSDASIAALSAARADPNPAPGYCKHCKDYTVEEPLKAEQQEPVAWMNDEGDVELSHKPWMSSVWLPLYTAPQPAKREPLTDAEIDRVTDVQWASNNHKPIYAAHRAYARAIERAHGIGEPK